MRNELSEKQLAYVHKKLYHLLYVFKEICRKENIWYSLAYGTMLGAVRHHGFISWDADADVYIKMADRDRFREAFAKYKPKGIFLNNYQTAKKCLQSHDTLKFVDDLPIKGLHLDIYILVGAPQKIWQQRIFSRYLHYTDVFIRSKYTDLRECKRKNIIPVFFVKILTTWIPDHVLKRNIYKRETKYDYFVSDYVISLATYADTSDCMPKQLWDEMIPCRFEHDNFNIPAKWKYYLSHVYGDDYMIPKKY